MRARSVAAQGVSITGDAQGNTITGGAGADTIDGGGGADVINAGSGNDTVHYHGTEVLIDGGFGSNTLMIDNAGGITRVDLSVAPGSDQTIGDTVNVANFQNIDASILTTGIVVTGSSSANAITTGSGNDTIDGGGGADTINAGTGNDTVSYYGSEVSIDGGAGTNTLVLRNAATVDLGNADQTTGDCGQRRQFRQCRCLRAGGRRDDHRIGGGQYDHRRRRQRHDRRRRRRRHHQCRRRRRHDRDARHRGVDRRRHRLRHAGAGGVEHRHGGQLRGGGRHRPDDRR